MKEDGLEFEHAVRDYLAGKRSWDSMHELALTMETENRLDFPLEFRRPLEELHLTFLTADSRDDSQFRASMKNIANILAELDQLKNDVKDLGTAVVAERERVLQEQQEQNYRLTYLEKRKKKHQ
jgi:hypothetical protein